MKIKNKILFIIIFLLLGLNFSSGGFYVSKIKAVDCDVLEGEERDKCEEDKDDIKDDIDSLEEKKAKAESQKVKLEQSLGKVQGAVYTTQKAIVTTENEIERTLDTIAEKEEYLEKLEKSSQRKKEALKKIIQENYYNSHQPSIFVFLDKNIFLDAVTKVDNFTRVNEEVLLLMDEIKKDKATIKNEAQELSDVKKEKEELLEIKESQKQALQIEASGIQKDVAKKVSTISEIQSKLSDLKNDLNKLLGKSYDTNDVKEAIKFANNQTGVDKGFLFGMLSIESRLGSSVGGCDYKQSRMSPARSAIFKDICESLDYNYKKQKVSCPPSGYKGTGGAMGAAQFMSDTWKGYEAKISKATGHSPADPWNLVDGVMAMALKLENDGATNGGKVKITSPCNGKKINVDWEDYAAMKYLGWSCYALSNYAPNIQAMAGGYKNL